MTYRGIIFDMDGVLFDTENFYHQRRSAFFASKGISIEHLPPTLFVGGRSNQVWDLILQKTQKKWSVEQLNQEYTAYKEAHPTPYKALLFPDTIKSVQTMMEMGLDLVIGSNTDKAHIEMALMEAGLAPYFKAIFSGADCKAYKPHPDVYQVAHAFLGYATDQVLVIEDSTKGIQAAVSAGLEVWAIKEKRFDMDQSQATRLVSNLSQVVEYLKQSR